MPTRIGRLTSRRMFAIALGMVVPVSAAWACPVPVDADSAYHTISRIARMSPAHGFETDLRVAGRDPVHSAACEGGQAAGYPCSNVDLLSYLPLSEIGGSQANDIWGWTDAATGKEYALIGKTDGTAFVDISDPSDARYLGMLPSHTGPSAWRDLKTIGNHALIVSEAAGHGMQVFDLTTLRDITAPTVFAETAHYAGFGAAHNIVVNEQTGFAYAVGTRNVEDGCGGGLHMIDVSEPMLPGAAGCFAGDGYTHDAQCVIYNGPDPDYRGREICFNYNEDTLTIVDVTVKSAPVQIARQPYLGSGYTHQGWLTEDQVHLLLDDETDELTYGHNTRTYIWNIADLDAPQLIGSPTGTTAAIDHNLYINGNFVYQANYRAGLRVLDLSGVAAGDLNERGFFDIYPSDDAAAFDGAWSAYPFFQSGVVILSGIEQGLFVLQPTALESGFTLSTDDDVLEICGDGLSGTFVDVDPVGTYAGSVALTAATTPAGAEIAITPTTVSPPATVIVSATVSGAAAGIYPLTVTGVDGELQYDQPLSLHLSAAAPASAQLLLPAPGAEQVSILQTLHWSAVPGAIVYDLEVATDADFSDVVVTATGLTQRHFSAPGALAPETRFYWRVHARNACGSVASSVGTFTTGALSCTVAASSDVPVNIPATTTGTFASTLSVGASGSIVDVNVLDLRLDHSWIGDIDIRLEGPLYREHGSARHPERPNVLIMARSCGNQDNLDLNFDDEAPPGSPPCPPVGGGTYQPANPLAAFDGSPGSGDWSLLVTDNALEDGGALTSWALEVCTAPEGEVLDLDGDGVDDLVDNCLGLANADQRDTNGDGYGNLCDPDLNDDQVVNFLDLQLMRQVFFSGASQHADLDGDGGVNFADLNRLRQYLFGAPGPSGLAP